ncbi:hypothetical protein [Streptomyces chattanoogensis]|uniref:Uncharacterized protein n=1 Tax=Streptomyces chattanoogensis TaxID=66876 RepID=A0A0N0XXH6_9ACTN|nr:hypothetical protein [Streptomyces chattanoogensis]KPC64694.1 hypothetical protein ADL29_11000 [Streptomyces chattanoogensis]
MGSETVFREPLWTTQSSPLQLRPRALLDMAINGFARYLAEHLLPCPTLVHKHGTVVVRTLRLDGLASDLCFAHASWLDVGMGIRTTVSDAGEWPGITLNYRTDDRPAARARLVLRGLSVAEPDSLSAQPGRLPESLLARFPADGRWSTDEFRDHTHTMRPFDSDPELLAPQEGETSLTRSRCEVADQWSFIEMTEPATTARERTFGQPGLPADAVRQAVAAPVRSLMASFQRPLFVFDRCRTLTHAHRTPDGDQTVFAHAIHAGPGLPEPELHPHMIRVTSLPLVRVCRLIVLKMVERSCR